MSVNFSRRAFEIVALIAFVSSGYYLADKLLFTSPAVTPPPAPDCTLGTTPCRFSNGTAQLSDDIAKPLLPSQLTVELSDNAAEYLLLELEGVQMDMGVYKVKLTPNGANRYSGELMLPICADAEMTWRGNLITPDNRVLLPLDVRMAR